jgi:hypothetical protein
LSTTISQGSLTVTLPAFSVVEIDATE